MVHYFDNMKKPFSPACERNKSPILGLIKQHLVDVPWVLEIGSGTGQHAVFFTEHMTHLWWQTSEVPENLAGLQAQLADQSNQRLPPPLPLDVTEPRWLDKLSSQAPAVFTSNTLHILSWPQVEMLFKRVEEILTPKGLLFVYGPFNYNQSYTSESNALFDRQLRQRNPSSGLRDFGQVHLLAEKHSLKLVKDYPMPANNRLIIWQSTKP